MRKRRHRPRRPALVMFPRPPAHLGVAAGQGVFGPLVRRHVQGHVYHGEHRVVAPLFRALVVVPFEHPPRSARARQSRVRGEVRERESSRVRVCALAFGLLTLPVPTAGGVSGRGEQWGTHKAATAWGFNAARARARPEINRLRGQIRRKGHHPNPRTHPPTPCALTCSGGQRARRRPRRSRPFPWTWPR